MIAKVHTIQPYNRKVGLRNVVKEDDCFLANAVDLVQRSDDEFLLVKPWLGEEFDDLVLGSGKREVCDGDASGFEAGDDADDRGSSTERDFGR